MNPNTDNEVQRKTVSAMDTFACRIMIQNTGSNLLHRCRHLLHQFLTDMYAKIQSESLSYNRHNQRTLRINSYIYIRDTIQVDAPNIGLLVIFPSSSTANFDTCMSISRML